MNKSGTFINSKLFNYAVCLVKFVFSEQKTSKHNKNNVFNHDYINRVRNF